MAIPRRYFYTSDTLEKLVAGFNYILQGWNVLSRKVICKYIRFYRDRQCAKTSPHYLKLTKREQQIIKLLGDGASNTQIADTLLRQWEYGQSTPSQYIQKIKVERTAYKLWFGVRRIILQRNWVRLIEADENHNEQAIAPLYHKARYDFLPMRSARAIFDVMP